jgi:hypothetical protein
MPEPVKVEEKAPPIEGPYSSSDPKNKPKEEKVETKSEVKPEVKPEPKTESKPELKTEPGSKLKRAQISIEDEIPEDAELLELSKTALNSRLKRHTSRELRERFGTDDTAEIKKKLDRLVALEAEEEARKREAMSEKDRLESDLRAATAREEDLNRRIRMMETDRIVSYEDNRISKIAHRHIDSDPEMTEVVFKKFSSHLKSEFAEQLKDPKFDVPDKDIEKWFKKFADEHPKFARSVAERPTPEKRPLNNGADTRETPAAENKSGAANAQKNFSPSSQNAMTRLEARAAAAKQGYQW